MLIHLQTEIGLFSPSNCKENLKQFLCGMAYPDCTPSGVPNPPATRVAVPSSQSCSLAIGSCIPPDTPASVRSFLDAAFLQFFRAINQTVSDCPSLYTYISNTPIPGLDFNNISTAYDFTPNCACSVPAGLNTCGGSVTYPVWSFIAAQSSSIEASASSAISGLSSALFIAELRCNDCSDQVTNSICTAAFFRCSPDASRLFIPPCNNVCNDMLTSCRIDQLNTPGVLGMLRSVWCLHRPTHY
eukprot:TRINITY_DN277_c0_g1_i3.p2 TRINITY_DN277_c0_g1~~TRINITY_DN277_c0_g1_i3.p2  ORF type:complete len:243 (-),score=28.82 TRINITY_DN277_c0_g1_i3:1283-2011(-)